MPRQSLELRIAKRIFGVIGTDTGRFDRQFRAVAPEFNIDPKIPGQYGYQLRAAREKYDRLVKASTEAEARGSFSPQQPPDDTFGRIGEEILAMQGPDWTGFENTFPEYRD